MSKLIISLVLVYLLVGCGVKTHNAPPAKVSKTDSPIAKNLLAYYNQWRGVKYLNGGLTKKGVDCSGFVHLAYRKKLNKIIPRSTELMSRAGKQIKMQALRPGDVVFFKTGWKDRHVGVYVGKGEFMHASSSRGVMISKLNNPYWANAYWMSRRY